MISSGLPRISLHAMISLLTLMAACSRTAPGPPPPDPLSRCLPETRDDGSLQLAVRKIESLPNETRVRLVAYAVGEAVEFVLPVYHLSRGRWLIDERYRSYLIDPQCRQFNLHDRHDSPGMPAPASARVKLKPGEAFETTVEYPPLPKGTRHGVLVYGAHAIPFSILPTNETDRPISDGGASK